MHGQPVDPDQASVGTSLITQHAAGQGEPTTPAGKRVADDMRRVQNLSQSIWNATGGLLTLLGASAPFTFALSLDHPEAIPIDWLIRAIISVLIGAIAYFVIQTITASRTRQADTLRIKSSTSSWIVIACAFALQLLALPAAAGSQFAAVYFTIKNRDPASSRALDAQLRDRLRIYVNGTLPPVNVAVIVKNYCQKHDSDNTASNLFLTTCIHFEGSTPPSIPDAKRLIVSLEESLNR